MCVCVYVCLFDGWTRGAVNKCSLSPLPVTSRPRTEQPLLKGAYYVCVCSHARVCVCVCVCTHVCVRVCSQCEMTGHQAASNEGLVAAGPIWSRSEERRVWKEC